ncbi:zinc finger and BTB domain-containing protein 7A-like isoform X3 [Portunus trituberculatus]|uniref:zinc finger and BTB domain-containing protein 7A-like isoform X3 n=1 Tax=Portunus trituberculatus TaxID=210409 RepID=UPI001E1CC67D|nr:zinc finger and BTB domain-containing protein 7A-like isoform X3 [Portunus trituberculatus]
MLSAASDPLPIGITDEKNRMDVRRYELRWTHHQSTVVAEVGSLYRDAALVDVTLACEDQRTYQAHKLVLSACSQYFQGLFSRHSAHQHPIIFLKDVSGDECEALLTYMYRGEVSVSHDQIHRILRVANSLQVRGLADMDQSSSRPSSPAGDRTGQCPSSSPSPSTGPPTKCATPVSEPQSPNPPPLVNPQISVGASSHPALSLPHGTSDPSPVRHTSVAAGALTAAIAGTRPHQGPPPHPIHPEYPHPYSLLPHRPYDLPGASGPSLLSVSEAEVNRDDLPKCPPSVMARSPYSSLRVKPDLGGNNWDSTVDVTGVSPLPLGDPSRPAYPLPTAIFSSFLQHDPHSAGSQPPYGALQRMFPISDPLRRLDRLSTPGNDTRIHKCQYCSRKFKRKDHLKTHIRIHTGERPYKCKVCGRGFIQSQQVKIHMKVHVREDSSGVGAPSSLGPGGGGGSVLPSLYSDLGGPFGDQPGLGAHHNDPNTDLDQSTDNNPPDNDSENECSSEIAEMDYDARIQQDSGNGGPGRTPPTPNPSSVGVREHKTPSPQSPPGTVSRSHPTPPDDQSCSAMSLKESYHIGSNIKK